MGSSPSKAKYPFPMPGNDSTHPPKSGFRWSLSTKKKSKKTKEVDDFAMQKYPTYPLPYYPQMPTAAAAYPTAYYAPVQMALVQPFSMQQPMLAMPQVVPMVYQTTAAPPVASAPIATQPVQAMQMPVPAPAPAPAVRMPIPAPAPAPVPVVPSTVPAQMPVPPLRGPTLPPSPMPAEPVIPPPPPGHFHPEPPRPAPDSVRPRFTDFYRPLDHTPRQPSLDAGRTPFTTSMPMPSSTPAPMPLPTPSSAHAPMSMPTPGSGPGRIPMSNNPLPPPPADVWETSPYRHVLANLPAELPDLLDLSRGDIFVSDATFASASMQMPEPEPDPVPRPSSRLAGLFSRDKGKKPMKGTGLFRSRSHAGHGDHGTASSSGSRHGHTRAQSVTSIVIPPPVGGSIHGRTPTGDMPIPMPTPLHQPGANSSMPTPIPAGPSIRFDHTGDYAGFVNHSPHRVMYKNKMYPTALHLLEAIKFTHKPALQERIRTCKDVNDMYPLSASFQEHVRPDWGQVFLKTMEEVLYLKFKQHPTLRTLLLRTGLAGIVYADENGYWGDGPTGNGANELGKALVRLRERLRQEGER